MKGPYPILRSLSPKILTRNRESRSRSRNSRLAIQIAIFGATFAIGIAIFRSPFAILGLPQTFRKQLAKVFRQGGQLWWSTGKWQISKFLGKIGTLPRARKWFWGPTTRIPKGSLFRYGPKEEVETNVACMGGLGVGLAGLGPMDANRAENPVKS